MRGIQVSEPITLGEKLSGETGRSLRLDKSTWLRRFLQRSVLAALLAGLSALAVQWLMDQLDLPELEMSFLVLGLFLSWLLLMWTFGGSDQHFLLKNDRQGFMHGLRLDKKTAVLDGSNIYHFGRDNGLDAQPLGEVAELLRSQGYRIICFFDANIFFTLAEHGAFPASKHHSMEMLEDIFGISENEIYVVPGRVQADRYILECLKHLPVSFVVSNDRYRDYKDQYAAVMNDGLWRKGVTISGGEIRLRKHSRQHS